MTLRSNYPNPFNPSTTIDYGLPKAQEVSLVVYSITGRKITQPVDGKKSAGWHKVQLNAADWASGVYIYRLKTSDFQQTNKMILLK